MRELDVLLTEFLRTRYVSLDSSARDDFAELLELQDPEIWAYLLGRAEPEAGLADIVRQIRDFSPR
jgi:antitoxin CptB